MATLIKEFSGGQSSVGLSSISSYTGTKILENSFNLEISYALM